jgi:hypothetical protein
MKSVYQRVNTASLVCRHKSHEIWLSQLPNLIEQRHIFPVIDYLTILSLINKHFA